MIYAPSLIIFTALIFANVVLSIPIAREQLEARSPNFDDIFNRVKKVATPTNVHNVANIVNQAKRVPPPTNVNNVANIVHSATRPTNIKNVASIFESFFRRDFDDNDVLTERDLDALQSVIEELVAREPSFGSWARGVYHRVRRIVTPQNIAAVRDAVKSFSRREEGSELFERDLDNLSLNELD